MTNVLVFDGNKHTYICSCISIANSFVECKWYTFKKMSLKENVRLQFFRKIDKNKKNVLKSGVGVGEGVDANIFRIKCDQIKISIKKTLFFFFFFVQN